jgi:hypothetical protein
MKINGVSTLFAAIAVGIFGSAQHLRSQEVQSSATGGTTLMIVASQSGERFSKNEFIVLRSSGSAIAWTATDTTSRETKEGKFDAGGVELAEVFDRVGQLSDKKGPRAYACYSLVLIDQQGARSCGPLNQEQVLELHRSKELARALRDIQRTAYGRAHLMLGLVLPTYRPTQIATYIGEPGSGSERPVMGADGKVRGVPIVESPEIARPRATIRRAPAPR